MLKYYQDNGIVQLTDNDFRSLIKSEYKNYKNTEQSVRVAAGNDYIKGELTVSYEKAVKNNISHYNNNQLVVKDADSFYKLIYNKMAYREYSDNEFLKLYVNVSEKLVHSTLTKGEINQFYTEHGINKLTEQEWDRLFTRQETRRKPDNIAEKSGNLRVFIILRQGILYSNYTIKPTFKIDG